MERKTFGFVLMTGLLLAAAVGLFVGGPRQRVASAQPAAPSDRSITVTGEAFVALKPDQVHLRFTVAQTLAGANGRDGPGRVTAALRAHGVARDDVSVVLPGVAPAIPGAPAVALVEATLRNVAPEAVREAVEAATAQHAQLIDAHYVSARHDQMAQQALNQAMRDALAKARGLAGAAGGTVGRVKTVEAQPLAEEGASLLGPVVPVLPGTPGLAAERGSGYGLRARVAVTYELR